MAQIDVAAVAVKLPVRASERPAVFNVGTGTLYLGRSNAVTTDNGFPVLAGGGYEFPGDLNGELWGVSDTTADVRILVVG